MVISSSIKNYLKPTEPLAVLTYVYDMFVKTVITKEKLEIKRNFQLALTKFDGIWPNELGMKNLSFIVPLTAEE